KPGRAGRLRFTHRATTPLDTPVHNMRSSVHDHLGAQWTDPNAMTGRNDRVELLQGTLDLIVLQALATMGAQHAYGLTARLEQVADHPFSLNQGTLYPALVRLEQKGWLKGTWQTTEKGREAKYYAITKAGVGALEKQASRWRRLAGLVD